MNPKPFSALKNFTVPVANAISSLCLDRSGRPTPPISLTEVPRVTARPFSRTGHRTVLRAPQRRSAAPRRRLCLPPPDPGALRRDRCHGRRPPRLLPPLPRDGPGRVPAGHRPSVPATSGPPASTSPCSRWPCSTCIRCTSTTRSTSTSVLAAATRATFQIAYLLTRGRPLVGHGGDGARRRDARRPAGPAATVAAGPDAAVTRGSVEALPSTAMASTSPAVARSPTSPATPTSTRRRPTTSSDG